MNNKIQDHKTTLQDHPELTSQEKATEACIEPRPKEIGGRTRGLEPTRYGDWEFKGRCIDF